MRFVKVLSAVEGWDGEDQEKSADKLIPNDAGRFNNVWNDMFGEVPRDARFESHHTFRLTSGGRVRISRRGRGQTCDPDATLKVPGRELDFFWTTA